MTPWQPGHQSESDHTWVYVCNRCNVYVVRVGTCNLSLIIYAACELRLITIAGEKHFELATLGMIPFIDHAVCQQQQILQG